MLKKSHGKNLQITEREKLRIETSYAVIVLNHCTINQQPYKSKWQGKIEKIEEKNKNRKNRRMNIEEEEEEIVM